MGLKVEAGDFDKAPLLPFSTETELEDIHSNYSCTGYGRNLLRISGTLGFITSNFLKELKKRKEERSFLKALVTILHDVSTDFECVEEMGYHGAHTALLSMISSDGRYEPVEDDILYLCEKIVTNASLLCTKFGLEFPIRSVCVGIVDEKSFPLAVSFREDEQSLDPNLLIRQIKDNLRQNAIGGDEIKANYKVGYRLWGASVVLCKEIFKLGSSVFAGKSILEIGSGLGLPGLLLCHPFFKAETVHLSDFNTRVVDNLQYNIELNQSFWYHKKDRNTTMSAKAFSLDWDAETVEGQSYYDVIVGSDLICQESDAYAVARLLDQRLSADGVAFITLGSQHSRYGVKHFLPHMESTGQWTITEICFSAEDGNIFKYGSSNSNELTGVFVGGACSYVSYTIKRR